MSSPKPKTIDEITITQPFRKWLKLMLIDLGFEKREFDEEDAYLISMVDHKEQLVHVQFSTKEWPISKPVVWLIKYWLADVKRRQLLQEKCAAERLEANKRTENANKIAHKMSIFMGLPEDKIYAAAMRIASKKDIQAAKNWGVELDL